MNKIFFSLIFSTALTLSVFAYDSGNHGNNGNNGNNGNHGNNGNGSNHPGGSGTPEPATMLLIFGGGIAAYGIKRLMPNKK